MKLILLGAPGAGKGTQAAKISEILNIPAISTGNMLRAAIKDGTETGKRAQGYIASGGLVPDEIIMDIVVERLSRPDCRNGFILDGVPRNIPQAKALEKAGIAFDAVILIDITDAEIMERMSGRRVCGGCGASYHIKAMPPQNEGICDSCGEKLIRRADDAPETVEKRLRVYHTETEPLIEFYSQRGILKKAATHQTVEENTREILSLLRYIGV